MPASCHINDAIRSTKKMIQSQLIRLTESTNPKANVLMAASAGFARSGQVFEWQTIG